MRRDLPDENSFEYWKEVLSSITIEDLLKKIKDAQQKGYLESDKDIGVFPGVIYRGRNQVSRFPEDLQHFMHVANIEMAHLFIKKLRFTLTQYASDPRFLQDGVLDFNSLLLFVLEDLLKELDIQILMVFHMAAVSQGDSGFDLLDDTLAVIFTDLDNLSSSLTNNMFETHPNMSQESHCPFPTTSRSFVNISTTFARELSNPNIEFNNYFLRIRFKILLEEMMRKRENIDLTIEVEKP